MKDLKQIFKNCKRYNPPNSDVYIMGQKVEALLLSKEKDYPKVEQELLSKNAKTPAANTPNPVNKNKRLNNPPDSQTPSKRPKVELEAKSTSKMSTPKPSSTSKSKAASTSKAETPSVKLPTSSSSTSKTPAVSDRSKLNQLSGTSTDSTKRQSSRSSRPPKPVYDVDFREVPKEIKACQNIIRDLMGKNRSAFSHPFHRPVDTVALGLIDYHDIIKKPMDFTTVLENAENYNYMSMDDMNSDVQLIFSNCYRYNPPQDPVCQMAKKCENFWNEKYKNLVSHFQNKEKEMLKKKDSKLNSPNSGSSVTGSVALNRGGPLEKNSAKSAKDNKRNLSGERSISEKTKTSEKAASSSSKHKTKSKEGSSSGNRRELITGGTSKKGSSKKSKKSEHSKNSSRKNSKSKDDNSSSSDSESESADSEDSDDNDTSLDKDKITKKLVERLTKLDQDRKNTAEVLEKLDPEMAKQHPPKPSLEVTQNLIRNFSDPATSGGGLVVFIFIIFDDS